MIGIKQFRLLSAPSRVARANRYVAGVQMRKHAVILGALLLSIFSAIRILADSPQSFSGGDGSRMATAVVIHAYSDLEGTKAEHAWLRTNHPGGKITKQSLISSEGHMYDSLDVVAADGTTHNYYFDITETFGKLN